MKTPFPSRHLVTTSAAALLIPILSGFAADPNTSAAPDAMADMRAKAAAVEASAASENAASPTAASGMSMDSSSDSPGMQMGGADSKAASPAAAPMKGMMGGMKGKMGKMKMSMDEMKGMAGDKGMKSKMEGMKSMMSDMEGMMGKMESMMDSMPDMGGMMGDDSMKSDDGGMAGMNMGGADSKAASPPSAPMKGMMGGMKGKMGKMKMSMDEMEGMAGDKGMKSKMEGMKSMMSDMEGMMGKMESMMGGMPDMDGMMGDDSMKPGDGGMAEMNPKSADPPASTGMQMMGAMGDSSSVKSALPGFPGASHLYHVGSTGFFLDHEEHITLSPEQTKTLNAIAEKSRLEQATTDRQIAEANQTLFTLTGVDQPDAEKIDGKITEIENLAGERRRAFIRQVGEAAKVLTEEQRKVLVGQPMPNGSSTTKPADPTMSGGMSDM